MPLSLPPKLMRMPMRRIMLALTVQAAAFWLVLAVLGLRSVDPGVWLALQGTVAFSLVLLCAAPSSAARRRAGTWMAVAFYAVFLAAFFAGAELGLDALHGVQRRRAQMGSELGGLALWQLLCPGLFSLALGALVNCWRSEARGIKPAG